jgi:glycosyl transferase family 25
MNLFVINMARSLDRMALMARQLDTLDLPFTRIDAIDAQKLSEQEKTDFSAPSGRLWHDGQIGCFLSHQAAWRAAAISNNPFSLILEDDVHLADALPPFVSDTSWIPADAAIVRIEDNGQWLRLGPMRQALDRRVAQVLGKSVCASAYIMRKETAQWLLTVVAADYHAADLFLFDPHTSSIARALSVWQLSPALCIQDSFDYRGKSRIGLQSNIESASKPRYHKLLMMRRAISSRLRGKTRIGYR